MHGVQVRSGSAAWSDFPVRSHSDSEESEQERIDADSVTQLRRRAERRDGVDAGFAARHDGFAARHGLGGKGTGKAAPEGRWMSHAQMEGRLSRMAHERNN